MPLRRGLDIVPSMMRDEAIAKLRTHADAVRAMGAVSLYLFGSTARDEAAADSDIDLFIEYDPASRFNAFDLIGIKLFLEERLGTDVDVAARDGLHAGLRDGIERTALRIF